MHSFIVKTTGGAASQLLGLMNALELGLRVNANFKIRHYIFGTGVYYPFALNSLVTSEEVDSSAFISIGYKGIEESILRPGEVITSGPIQRKTFNYESLLGVIRRLNLESSYRSLLRGELMIKQNSSVLYRARSGFRYMSGGYVPEVSEEVHRNLRSRFDSSRVVNIYEEKEEFRSQIVVHYRIGDVRRKFAYPTAPGDGILDPACIKKIIERHRLQNEGVMVVSDSPHLAKSLLAEVGITDVKVSPGKDIWADIAIMTSAKLLIAPHSQVSQIAMSIRALRKLASYYPGNDSLGHNHNWRLPFVKNYVPSFLNSSHWIFGDKTEARGVYEEYNQ